MEDKYVISDVCFEKNVINCGQETFYSCIKNSFDCRIKEEELFFLSNPYSFTYVREDYSLEFETIYEVYRGIKENIINDIEWHNMRYKKLDADLVCKYLRNDRLILVCVDNAVLSLYLESRTRLYPYHLLIIYGFDLSKEVFLVTDLYASDDYGKTIKFVKLDMNFVINHSVECVVFGRNKKKCIINDKKNIMFKSINEIVMPKGFLDTINNYFLEIDNVDIEKIINGVSSIRWIIIIPVYMNLYNIIDNVHDKEEIKLMIKEWEILLLKYLKCCYKNIQQLYERLRIKELIKRHKEIISKIIRIQNKI